MAGWRGAGSSIPVGRHGSGGIYGGQLSPTLTPASSTATGSGIVLSNTASLPNRNNAVYPAYSPGTLPGTQWGVPGRVVNDAYGNPGKSSEAAKPSGGQGAGTPLAPGEASLARVQPYPHVSYLNVGQESYWRGGLDFANDKLEAYDRHGVLNTGTERGGGRRSGETDPPMDGPPRPSLRIINRVINWQEGNPLANQDHEPGENRGYSMAPSYAPFEVSAHVGDYGAAKRAFESGPQYIAEQGTGWSPVYGGVPGLWQPYGSYQGYTADSIKGIQSPAAEGTVADGPQDVWSGLPHGLHSQTYPDYSTTLGRYLAIPQQLLPRQDRPSNSTTAGQAYNQLVQPQGQTGTVGVQEPPGSNGQTASQVALSAWRGSQGATTGWRGIRPGGGQT